VLHIYHFFLHPSLSDSNLPFDNLLKSQIPAPFQRKGCEPRAKIAALLVQSKSRPATLPRFANNLAMSVLIQPGAGKFSGFYNSLWPAVCIEEIILISSHQKDDANTSVHLRQNENSDQKNNYPEENYA